MMTEQKLLPREYKKTTDSSDKGVMFFSASSVDDLQTLVNFGIREVLVSYFYIRKAPKKFEELINKCVADGGLFMTDSGAFSFNSSKKPLTDFPMSFWIDYLEEYTEFIRSHSDKIFVAANLDIESIVGTSQVDKWNEEYFKPLEEHTQIVYVAHRDNHDYSGLRRFHRYCSEHKYVGVSFQAKERFRTYYSIAQATGTRIHGFGWTSIPMLKQCPFFSVDSTTWMGGVRYGETYKDDGKNFSAIDGKKKWRRKALGSVIKRFNIDKDALAKEERYAVHTMNLAGWLGARREFVRSANSKLRNKPVKVYRMYKV